MTRFFHVIAMQNVWILLLLMIILNTDVPTINYVVASENADIDGLIASGERCTTP